MQITISTTCEHVYRFADAIGDLLGAESIMIPTKHSIGCGERGVEEVDALVGREVAFAFTLADGTEALRGRGRVLHALHVSHNIHLRVSSQHLVGPAATLVWESQRRLRGDRYSLPAVAALWDDETVRDERSLLECVAPDGTGIVDVTRSGTLVFEVASAEGT